MELKHIEAGQLRVAYAELGNAQGWPCFLMHGFPYDIHAYQEVGPLLAAEGARVIIPYLRGYGATRFLSPHTPHSGEQAALGADLLALMDSLGIQKVVRAGYDWGGRACCIVAALWPERVTALVTGNGYNIQNIAQAMVPASPDHELQFWYQYYFHCERGCHGLEQNREALCKLLWKLWSPTWNFDDATFAQTAVAFSNPDFVDVVIHSYRHRFGLVAGDPAVGGIERQLAAQPSITVPTVVVDGDADGVAGVYAEGKEKFAGPTRQRIFKDCGHNLPQERPQHFADAVLEAKNLTSR